MSLLRELKRRNVFRVAAAYLVGAWLLIEVSSTLEETLLLPDWADSLLAMFLLVGFPVALFFSWAFEITPDGVRRESATDVDPAGRAITARRLDWAVIVMVVIALGLMALDLVRPAGDPAVMDSAPTMNVADADAPAAVAPALADDVHPLSIAVLPFVNMSSDPEQEFFSDGLTEELLNLLAGIRELRVTARTSSFFYKDKLDVVPLKDIAQALEVAHVLEGSVRKGGDKIRVTAQLIRVDNGFHLWSGTWDRTLDDIFAIQDEIAAAVVDELRLKLLDGAPKARPIDPRSFELAMHGRYLFNRRDPGDLEKALELFEAAIEIDPENAVAWAGAAPLYIWVSDPPNPEKFLEAAREAVRLDPDNAAARWRLAHAIWNRDQDVAAFREETRRAWEIGQEDPLVLSVAAGMFRAHGDVERAIELQRRAVAADPLHLVALGNLANYLMESGRLAEAREVVDKLGELAPQGSLFQDTRAYLELLSGRPARALELAESMADEDQTTGPWAARATLVAMAHHSLGQDAAADAALGRLLEDDQGFDLDRAFSSLAQVYAWRGESDQVLAIFERLEADERRNVDRGWLESPYFKRIEGDPRWEALKRDIMATPSPYPVDIFQ